MKQPTTKDRQAELIGLFADLEETALRVNVMRQEYEKDKTSEKYERLKSSILQMRTYLSFIEQWRAEQELHPGVPLHCFTCRFGLQETDNPTVYDCRENINEHGSHTMPFGCSEWVRR